MWSVPAKNMKKINMSISFVYDVSIQGNCENAVFTFLPFYKQNIAFLTYHCCVVDFGYSEGEIVMGLNTALRIYFYQEYLQIPAYKQDAGISYCKDCCRQNSAG